MWNAYFILRAWNVKCLFFILTVHGIWNVLSACVHEMWNVNFYPGCAWNVKYLFLFSLCVKHKLWNVYFYPVYAWTKKCLFLLLLLIALYIFIGQVRASEVCLPSAWLGPAATWLPIHPRLSLPDLNLWPPTFDHDLKGRHSQGCGKWKGRGEGREREGGSVENGSQQLKNGHYLNCFSTEEILVILSYCLGFFPFLFPPWSYTAVWDHRVNLVSTLRRLWCLNRLRDMVGRGNGRDVSAVGSKQNQARMVCCDGWRPVSDVCPSGWCLTEKGKAGLIVVQCQCCGAAKVVNQHKS